MRTIGEILTQLRRCPKRLLLFPLVLAVLYVLPGVLRNEIQQVVSEIDNVKNQVSQWFSMH